MPYVFFQRNPPVSIMKVPVILLSTNSPKRIVQLFLNLLLLSPRSDYPHSQTRLVTTPLFHCQLRQNPKFLWQILSPDHLRYSMLEYQTYRMGNWHKVLRGNPANWGHKSRRLPFKRSDIR